MWRGKLGRRTFRAAVAEKKRGAMEIVSMDEMRSYVPPSVVLAMIAAVKIQRKFRQSNWAQRGLSAVMIQVCERGSF